MLRIHLKQYEGLSYINLDAIILLVLLTIHRLFNCFLLFLLFLWGLRFMDEKTIFKPYLCGGTFFDLILQARSKRRHSTSNKITNKKNRECDCLLSLINIYHDIENDSFSDSTLLSNTSLYKRSSLPSKNWMFFSDKKAINKFNNQFNNNYFIVYKKMYDFCIEYGLDKEMNWLVSACLELISLDDTIADKDVFRLGEHYATYTKRQLLSLNEILFEPFMLSVWHYIVTKRPETSNEKGLQTYKHWHNNDTNDATSRKPPEFNSDIGSNYKPINVTSVSLNDYNASGINLGSLNKLSIEVSNDVNQELEHIVPDYQFNGFNLELYRKSVIEKYGRVRTLLFKNSLIPFYDIYICNGLLFNNTNTKNRSQKSGTELITNASIDKLSPKNVSIIVGPGGIGKSMMLRHLMLTSIDQLYYYSNSLNNDKNYSPKIPIFINLREYCSDYKSFYYFIERSLSLLCSIADIKYLKKMYDIGGVCFLLDGLDELSEENRLLFEQSFYSFWRRYPYCQYIISSRPLSSYLNELDYHLYQIQPLSKDQALQVIDKLNFRPDQPTIKEQFRNLLDTSLYLTHKEFVENPLLLNIMLMTFEQYAEIPSKIHRFYNEAYNTLTIAHDANKGAFVRNLKTGLDTDMFSELMEQFCAYSYKDGIISPTDDDIKRYLNIINHKNILPYHIDSQSFIYDLTTNTCLMYYENGRYNFIHRSFQEYFCALFFSKKKDRSYKKIGEFFQHMHLSQSDKTFEMLFDMVKWKVEEFIILPYLDNLISECESQPNSYEYFLSKIYPYTKDWPENNYIYHTDNFLHNFIILQYKIIEENNIRYTMYYSYNVGYKEIIAKYTELLELYNSKESIDSIYKIANQSKSFEHNVFDFSQLSTIETIEISSNPKIKDYVFTEILQFPTEYKNLKELLSDLKTKYSNQTDYDLFDDI